MNGKKEVKETQKLDQKLAVGMAFGLLFGVLLNSSGLWENHGLGFTLGPLLGMAIATFF